METRKQQYVIGECGQFSAMKENLSFTFLQLDRVDAK